MQTPGKEHLSLPNTRQKLYQALAVEAERFNRSQKTIMDQARLLTAFDNIQQARLTGEIVPVFVMRVYPTDQEFYPGPLSKSQAIAHPHIVLNEGEERPDQLHEKQLVQWLISLPVIDDDLTDRLVRYIGTLGFNGASPGAVGAFLLDNYGKRVAVEYL